MANLDPHLQMLAQHRAVSTARLSGYVKYIPLVQNSKLPAVKYSNTSSWTVKPPNRSNVGAIPSGRTVIIDIDTKTSTSPWEQADILRSEFGLPLDQTFTVVSPSGGLHMYLIWADGVELPRNRKLSKLPGMRGIVEGDIRAAGTNGYCVIPGSVVNYCPYLIERDLDPATVPSEVARQVTTLLRLDQRGSGNHSERPKAGSPEVEAALARPSFSLNRESIMGVFDAPKLDSLKRILAGPKYRTSTYSLRRAVVFNMLSCCEEDETIVRYWALLDIHRDTSKGAREIGSRYLMADAARLRGRASKDHCFLCAEESERRQRRAEAKHARIDSVPATYTDDQMLQRSLSRLRGRRGYRLPAVIDYPRVIEMLNEGRQKPGSGYPLAVAIMEQVIMPWKALGATNIMLGDAFLSKLFSVSPLDVKRAKRMLLKRGIIQITMRQATGRTTVFNVPNHLTDAGLTKLLLRARASTGREIIPDPRGAALITRDGEMVIQVRKWNHLVAAIGDVLPEELPCAPLTSFMPDEVKEVPDLRFELHNDPNDPSMRHWNWDISEAFAAGDVSGLEGHSKRAASDDSSSSQSASLKKCIEDEQTTSLGTEGDSAGSLVTEGTSADLDSQEGTSSDNVFFGWSVYPGASPGSADLSHDDGGEDYSDPRMDSWLQRIMLPIEREEQAPLTPSRERDLFLPEHIFAEVTSDATTVSLVAAEALGEEEPTAHAVFGHVESPSWSQNWFTEEVEGRRDWSDYQPESQEQALAREFPEPATEQSVKTASSDTLIASLGQTAASSMSEPNLVVRGPQNDSEAPAAAANPCLGSPEIELDDLDVSPDAWNFGSDDFELDLSDPLLR